MNKFFRLVSMFAIAGVTFAYTGCTDYSEDIDKANERIDNLENVELKSVKDQIDGLNKTVDGLKDAQTKAESAITELQTALGKLQEKHAADIAKLESDYKAADGALKSEIEGKITALTTEFTNKVTALNTQIGVLQTKVDGIDSTVKSIQETIETLATKEYVDTKVAALATKDALAEANKAIAALNETLGTVQSKVATLGEDLAAVKVDITGINTKLGEAQTAIEKAQADASKALTEITEIKEALKSYALKAEVEAKIEELVAADLVATGRLDGIDEKIEAITGQITNLFAKDVEFADQITQLFNEKFNKADFAEAFKTAYEARFSTDFADAFAKAWAEYFQPAFNTAFETAWNAKFQGEFDSALENVLGIYAEKDVLAKKIAALDGVDEDLQKQITALDEKLDKAVEDLNGKITKLGEKVEQYNTDLNNKINAVLGIIADRLTSIVFVPEYYVDGVPAILFETIAYNPLDDAKENEAATTVVDGKQNSISANKFKNYTTALTTAKYRLNPRTVGFECADFSFVGDKADYVVTRATAPAAPVSIEGTPAYDAATGYVTFSVKKNENLNVTTNTNKNLDIVALKAVLKQGLTEAEAKAEQKPEVYSEYAHVNEIAYSAANLAISDSAKLVKKAAGHEYAKTFNAAKAQAYVYKMPYNSDPFDLKALVATCINTKITTPGLEATQDHAKLDLDKYGLTYKFSVAQTPYVVESDETETDQKTVIECVDAEKGLYKVKAAKGVEFNKEAIGRTPIVRVDLMHNGNIVTRAFIKLLISVEKTYDLSTITGEELNKTLLCEDDPKAVVSTEISEETLRDAVYRTLNIDHVSFWNIYALDKAYVKKNGEDVTTITVPELKDGDEADGKATKKIVWNFTHKEVGVVGKSGSVIEGYLTLKNTIDAASEYPSEIKFKFTVNFKLPELTIVHNEKEIFWKNGVLQANVNTPASKTDDSKNCWFNTPIEEQPWYELSVKGLPCNETPMFKIVKLVENGDTLTYKNASQGVKLDELNGEVSISLDKKNETVKAALNSEKGLQAVVEWFAVGKSGDVYTLHTFMVNFIRPVNLNLPQTLKVKDALDNGDEVNVGIQGLLTDWRDSVIVAPAGMIEKTAEDFYWKKTCSGHAPVVIPGYTKIVKPASFEVVYGDAEAEILTGEKYYEVTVQLYKNDEVAKWYEGSYGYDIVDTRTDKYGFGYFGDGRKWHRFPANSKLVKGDVIVETGRSKNEALQYAKARIADMDPNYLIDNTDPRYAKYGDLDGRSYEVASVVEKEAKVTIKYRTIVDIKYVPAVTKEVPAQVIPVECNPMPGPSSDAIQEGYTVGCWTWTKYTYPYYDYDLGQYWQFYGPISDIVFDTAKVSTNLADKKLPSGASLVQDGYKLKYKNVLSPVLKSYEIYVPVSINYGWGVLADTLTITVIPQNSVQ